MPYFADIILVSTIKEIDFGNLWLLFGITEIYAIYLFDFRILLNPY